MEVWLDLLAAVVLLSFSGAVLYLLTEEWRSRSGRRKQRGKRR